ncbi:MAG: hypothetical protein JO368_00155, partial [Acidimicrobiales bacterium]|nr:hypothetical protein [Acidimicrobiales bacterium]
RRDSWAGRTTTRLFAKGIREKVVNDQLSEHALVPDYPVGCKRVLISSDWYPTLLRPDVELVDTPIERIEPSGVTTVDGVHHPADALVFATGFDTTHFLAHIPVRGVGGRSLAEEWRAGAHAYLGTMVAGFPNCYLLYGPNTNLGHNSILFMVERQVNLILQALALQTDSADGPSPVVAVDRAAYHDDDIRTQRRLTDTAWVGACRSWYKDAAGRVVNNWPTWTVRYWYETLRLRPTEVRLVTSTPTAPAGPAPADATDRPPEPASLSGSA